MALDIQHPHIRLGYVIPDRLPEQGLDPHEVLQGLRAGKGFQPQDVLGEARMEAGEHGFGIAIEPSRGPELDHRRNALGRRGGMERQRSGPEGRLFWHLDHSKGSHQQQ